MIRYVRRYTREEIAANRDTYYVFGDNMARYGRGGQAAACRGLPNTIGVPTKWLPSNEEHAFFRDEDFANGPQAAIDEAFEHIERLLRDGATVVFPADGLGTGLADLPHRAPETHAYICDAIQWLDAIYGE